MVILLPAGLAFLMLVVGLRLTTKDFRGLWERPQAVIGGLLVQMVGLPLLAAAISWLLALPPFLSLGLLVVAAAPGGITSNFITLLARGDAALSATMTLGTSLAASLSIPLVLLLGQSQLGNLNYLALAVAKTGAAVAAVSAAPLLAGMMVRRSAPGIAELWGPRVEQAATLVFLVLVATAFYQNWDAMLAHARSAGPASVLLNLGAISAGLGIGSLLHLPARQTLAIAIECGLQNVAMAMFVSASLLHNDGLMIPALVYAVIMNITALALLIGGRFAMIQTT